jgi:coenzyme PQQ precursor peptide PqqA
MVLISENTPWFYGAGLGASSSPARRYFFRHRGQRTRRLIDGARPAMLIKPALGRRYLGRNANMAWKTPRIVEVSLALEINSYACAEIG